MTAFIVANIMLVIVVGTGITWAVRKQKKIIQAEEAERRQT